jgi:hypothetical protein
MAYRPWRQWEPLRLGSLGAMDFDATAREWRFACLPWLPDLALSHSALRVHKWRDAAAYPLPGECRCERPGRRARGHYPGKVTQFLASSADYFPRDLLLDLSSSPPNVHDPHSCYHGQIPMNRLAKVGALWYYSGGLNHDELHFRGTRGRIGICHGKVVQKAIRGLLASNNRLLLATDYELVVSVLGGRSHNLQDPETIQLSKCLRHCDLHNGLVAWLQEDDWLRTNGGYRAPTDGVCLKIVDEQTVLTAKRDCLCLYDVRQETPSASPPLALGGQPCQLACQDGIIVVSSERLLSLFDVRNLHEPLLQYDAMQCFGGPLENLLISRLPPTLNRALFGINDRSQLFCIPLVDYASQEHTWLATRHPHLLDTLTCNSFFTQSEPWETLIGLQLCPNEQDLEIGQLYQSGRFGLQSLSTEPKRFDCKRTSVNDLIDQQPLCYPQQMRPVKQAPGSRRNFVALTDEQIVLLDQLGIPYTDDRRLPAVLYDALAVAGIPAPGMHLRHIPPSELRPDLEQMLQEWSNAE